MFKIGDRVKFIAFLYPDWVGAGTIMEIDGHLPTDMCLVKWDEPSHDQEYSSFEYIEDIEYITESNDILKGML